MKTYRILSFLLLGLVGCQGEEQQGVRPDFLAAREACMTDAEDLGVRSPSLRGV